METEAAWVQIQHLPPFCSCTRELLCLENGSDPSDWDKVSDQCGLNLACGRHLAKFPPAAQAAMHGDQLRSLREKCKKKTKHSTNDFVGRVRKIRRRQTPLTAGHSWRPASWLPRRKQPSLQGARWSRSGRSSQRVDHRSRVELERR